MNELKKLQPVLAVVQEPVIQQNLLDLAAGFQAQMDYVKELEPTEENAKKVKEIRAACNKQVEQLETQRKAVKAAVLAPYEAAEKVYKSFVSEPHKKLDETCKAFVGQVENKLKADCEERLKEYFAELIGMKGLHWLRWERLGIRPDLTAARQKEPKALMERIRIFVNRVSTDTDTLGAMENAAELLAEYEDCLDVSEAIRRVHSRKEAQRIAEENRKAREERLRESRAMTAAVINADVGAVAVVTQEVKLQATFTVTATRPMLRGLVAFLENNKYEYKEEE